MKEAKIDIESYVVTDSFFGAPYIDFDGWLDEPQRHRQVHGGFQGTDTRFTFYFPPVENYRGRLYQPIEGAAGGHERAHGNAEMEARGGGLGMCVRLGGYMVESNQGHIGDDIDPKGGDDPTLYGHRASAESARFSKFVAAQVYGQPPHHAYVFGGSGGGRRSPLCLSYAPDAWDGALPYVGGGEADEHGSTRRIRNEAVMAFGTEFNVQRVLGSKLDDVVDAMAPGGSGDPFAGLNTHQREELAALYRLGYPRGDEHMISNAIGPLWLWCSQADQLAEDDDREYFEQFWTTPGYVGHDLPELVAHDLIDSIATVSRAITPRDLGQNPEFAGPEYQRMRGLAALMGAMTDSRDLAMAVEVTGLQGGYRLGAGLRLVTGQAAGRQLYCMSTVGDVFFCDGRRDANLLRFTDVLPGDEVHVDNHRFLAYCYYARHHVLDVEHFDFFKVDGRAIYPQHEVPAMAPSMGVPFSGQYAGKLLYTHNTHDGMVVPPQAMLYPRAILAAQGPEGMAERFRMRWTENAEHGGLFIVPDAPGRAASTRLIEYQPVTEQSLADLAAWVEDGIVPEGTNFEYRGARVFLPATAAERGGIQPVVSVTANGGSRAEVGIGEPVTLEMQAEVPPKAGTIISVAWDFDGSGDYPFTHDVAGTATKVRFATTHTYDRPGTYFATALVESHRHGDIKAAACRIPNLASARIVVA